MRRAISKRQHTRVYLWTEAHCGEGMWSLVSLIPARTDEDEAKQAANSHTSSPPWRNADGTVGAEEAPAVRYMMGVQYGISKEEMRFVFDKVLAYRLAHWCPANKLPPPSQSPNLALKLDSPTQKPMPSPTSGAESAGSSKLPEALPPTPLTPTPELPACSSALVGALAAWQADFCAQHGRQATADETSAMVLHELARLRNARESEPSGQAEGADGATLAVQVS